MVIVLGVQLCTSGAARMLTTLPTLLPLVYRLDLWFDDVDPDDIEAALGPEAGQIARKMQGLPEKKSDAVDMILVKDRAFEG